MLIDFEPLGRRIESDAAATILDAAHLSGVDIAAICGGGGTCGACKIRLSSGKLSPVKEIESLELGEEAINDGYRLACQCTPLTDCKIEIPPESLTAPQRTQIEGIDSGVILDSSIKRVPITLTKPTAGDVGADDLRLLNALRQSGEEGKLPIQIAHNVLIELSNEIRKNEWSGSVVLSKSVFSQIIAFLPKKARLLGMAADLGSTKLALYLVDLETGETLIKTGAMNPQISYGEDVVSRIAYANTHPGGRKTLQSRLVESINELTLEMCEKSGTKPEWIVDSVMVGNTAMHHFLAGLPVEQLGLSPYLAAVGQAIEINAQDIGLNFSAGARVYLPPNLAGFVGADHVSMLLAAESWRGERTLLSMDIGTNTEISLLSKGKLFSCSCASGPAFEGAHIQSGMRAAPGAIERVQIRGGKIWYQTIDGKPPVGICGSGILEIVAEMRSAEIVDKRGVFVKSSPWVTVKSGKPGFELIPAAKTGREAAIIINRGDINEIQLAKSAIRAGVEVLIHEAGINKSDIDQFIIAGAFGTYLDIQQSINIGMFPDLPINRFVQIGNAAGVGARQMLLSRQKRVEAAEIANRMNYIELTVNSHFTDFYMDSMYIEKS